MARIIIADDDELVGEIACQALFDSGHVAGAVTDGREALRIVRERGPDLLVLDCNMPGMNGLLVLDELRRSSEFCDLPVLVLTGLRATRTRPSRISMAPTTICASRSTRSSLRSGSTSSWPSPGERHPFRGERGPQDSDVESPDSP